FFHAEDGIRDFHVTGVQTCALPISTCSRAPPSGSARQSRTASTTTSSCPAAPRSWRRTSRRSRPGCARSSPRPSRSCATSCRRRSEVHTSELQSREKLVCRLLLEKKQGLRRHTTNHTYQNVKTILPRTIT